MPSLEMIEDLFRDTSAENNSTNLNEEDTNRSLQQDKTHLPGQ
jgi:hypothetical protein